MAEEFNELFTSIGDFLQRKHSPNKKTLLDYLKLPNLERFIISLTTLEEVSHTIETLNNSKSTGPNSIPTKMKTVKDEIFIPLSRLINKSFKIGMFPNICKSPRVVPVFQSEARHLCNDYRPISLVLNIGKTIECM